MLCYDMPIDDGRSLCRPRMELVEYKYWQHQVWHEPKHYGWMVNGVLEIFSIKLCDAFGEVVIRKRRGQASCILIETPRRASQ